MEKIRFRSLVAKSAHQKSQSALVDFGGTHNFFPSKYYFTEYHKVPIQDVQSASVISKIVGMGTVILPIDGGVLKLNRITHQDSNSTYFQLHN